MNNKPLTIDEEILRRLIEKTFTAKELEKHARDDVVELFYAIDSTNKYGAVVLKQSFGAVELGMSDQIQMESLEVSFSSTLTIKTKFKFADLCVPRKEVFTATEVVELLFKVYKLKSTKRTGWLHRNISPLECESVSDHSFFVAFLSVLHKYNSESQTISTAETISAVELGLIHDVAECVVGDLMPENISGISASDKACREEKAIHQLFGDSSIAKLWKLYEERLHENARLVKDFDRFEMILQADVYERKLDTDLSEFFDSVHGKIEDKRVREWERVLRKRRQERRK
eukprot:maker-scaffold_15-snap-gene-1.30-mRNA-1 protein AED:0.35 eAED:0.43 QI:42/0/0.5/1/0/0/2/0/286